MGATSTILAEIVVFAGILLPAAMSIPCGV
jgi:hypothetical protein